MNNIEKRRERRKWYRNGINSLWEREVFYLIEKSMWIKEIFFFFLNATWHCLVIKSPEFWIENGENDFIVYQIEVGVLLRKKKSKLSDLTVITLKVQ